MTFKTIGAKCTNFIHIALFCLFDFSQNHVEYNKYSKTMEDHHEKDKNTH